MFQKEVKKQCIDTELRKMNSNVIVTYSDTKFSPKLKDVIEEIIEAEGFIKCDVTQKQIATEGGSFLADLYEIKIKGDTKNCKKETNLFVKNILSTDNIDFLSIKDIYIKEIFAYTELSKIINDLQEEFKVPKEHKYKMVKCFGLVEGETLLMENMNIKGFKVVDRMKNITLDYAEKAIQALAKFHSFSFIIKSRMPEYYETRIKQTKSAFYFNDDWKHLIKVTYETALNVLAPHAKQKFEVFGETYIDRYIEYYKTSTRGVLCHGDYRVNNLLVKETDGVISDLIPVDYQLITYGSPIHDILYLIFGCTDAAFRKRHLTHLKDLYHATLKTFLCLFDLDVEDCYPKVLFDQDFKSRLDFGLMSMINVLPFLLLPPEDAPDLEQGGVESLCAALDDVYADRMRELTDEFIELGYL